MKLKQVILAFMDLDTLKDVVEDLEIDAVDRRCVEAMWAKVSRSRRATPEMLPEYLNEGAVKAVCEEKGIDPKGRVSEGTRAKDDAIRSWCRCVSEEIDVQWRYARINQKDVNLSKSISLAALMATVQKRIPSILNPED
jgi:hypothetical protein